MMFWGKHKADADLVQGSLCDPGLDLGIYAKFAEYVGTARIARRCPVAMFGDRYASACYHEGGCSRNIERLCGTATSTHDVDKGLMNGVDLDAPIAK